jgi:hypothetical protein
VNTPTRLSDNDLRDVLARAEEIQKNSRHADYMRAEMEAVIGAGEAVGLTRPAVERALRERLERGVIAPPDVGSLVFAQSADGKYYVAEVLSVQGDAVRVRFLRGSQHNVTLEQVRSASFLPGERVVVNWPWWGPWTCTIVSYDAGKEKVKLSDGWGYARSFPISEVWQTNRTTWSGRFRIAATWLSVGVGLGALLGAALVSRLFP